MESAPRRGFRTGRWTRQHKAIASALLVGAAALGYSVYTSQPPAPGAACASVHGALNRPGSLESPGTNAPYPVPRSAVVAHGPAPGPAASDGGGRLAGSPTDVSVVAAENFWGSLVAQLGGDHAQVLSIVTDPNADPHEYESNITDATAIDHAELVIVNGAGYDDWALRLLAADPPPGPMVLNVGSLNGVAIAGSVVSGNPHMWYNPIFVNATVAAMYADLVRIDPSDAAYFGANYETMKSSLGVLYGEAASLRAQFAGSIVAATEDIFVYLANFTQLDLVSPPQFMQALAEGNDPPAESIVTFQCQLENGNVKLLVFNQQTATPITSQMEAIAAQHGIPEVGISETLQPAGASFQTWMGDEFHRLHDALNSTRSGG